MKASAETSAQRALRIVSLTPSTTEIVASLGAVNRLVGVDRYSSWPPQVRSLPKVGDFLSPNLDAILALTPDILLLDDVQHQVIQRLKGTKIQALPLRMQNLADVRAALFQVGRALGLPDEAERVVARLDDEIATVTAAAKRARQAAGRSPRVLFVVDRQAGGLGGIVAAGPGTYIDDLIRALEAENVLAHSPVRYAKITAEEVLALSPEVIFDAIHTEDTAKARTDWDRLEAVPAVRSGRVHVLGDSIFVSPGPRTGEAFRRLYELVWSRP